MRTHVLMAVRSVLRRRHCRRVLRSQKELARHGYSAGGRPPSIDLVTMTILRSLVEMAKRGGDWPVAQDICGIGPSMIGRST